MTKPQAKHQLGITKAADWTEGTMTIMLASTRPDFRGIGPGECVVVMSEAEYEAMTRAEHTIEVSEDLAKIIKKQDTGLGYLTAAGKPGTPAERIADLELRVSELHDRLERVESEIDSMIEAARGEDA